MVVIAIVAILAAIAYPSYQAYILRSHRSEAVQLLLSAQVTQEKYRVANAVYGTTSQLNLTNGTYYSLSSVPGTASNGTPTYVITATASGSQTADTACLTLSISNSDAKGTTTNCWQ